MQKQTTLIKWREKKGEKHRELQLEIRQRKINAVWKTCVRVMLFCRLLSLLLHSVPLSSIIIIIISYHDFLLSLLSFFCICCSMRDKIIFKIQMSLFILSEINRDCIFFAFQSLNIILIIVILFVFIPLFNFSFWAWAQADWKTYKIYNLIIIYSN